MGVHTELMTMTQGDRSGAPILDPAADRQTRFVTTALLALMVSLLIVVEWILVQEGGAWDMPGLLSWQSMIALYCVSGLLANWRQPNNQLGLLMVWTGLVVWCAGLQVVPYRGLALIGDITQTLPLAALVHLVMAYPFGRLPDRQSRVVVSTVYAVALLFQVPNYLFSGTGILLISDLPEVSGAFRSIQRFIGVAGLCVGLWVVLRRRLTQSEHHPRLGPLAWYGPIALLTLIFASLVRAMFSNSQTFAGNMQKYVILALPILFLIGLLTGSFGRAGELREFLARIGGDRLTPDQLEGAVARALGDRSAEVIYCSGDAGGYFAGDGSAVSLDPNRAVLPVHWGGDLVGAITYDADAVGDEYLLDVVARVSALAVDHQRVVVVLRAALLDLEESADSLRQAQYRLVRASDVERRRIARDLHDGIQQSVVVLGLRARNLIKVADDPEQVRGTAAELQSGMADLLADFRTLVHAIMPASLTDRGITGAIRDLSERTAVPLEVRSTGLEERLPAAIESTVYFVVLESVTNAVKYAAASGIWVDLRRDNGLLSAEVRDDGLGGAALGGGSGLEGIRDRVRALNGSLTVESGAASGTVVRALIPCG